VPDRPASNGQLARTSAPLEASRAQNESQIQDWLFQVGLGRTNPFARWDAGADPELSNYLVQHDIFCTIWHNRSSLVFAPLGGGKSAFRVRLAYACRSEEDERQVFSIPYLAPQPTATSLGAHLEAILRAAAQELLLVLVYRPNRFAALDNTGKQAVRRILDQNDPGLVSQFLPQIRRAGNLAPLVETFDPSARHLPDPAKPSQVHDLCDALERLSPVGEIPPNSRRFAELIDLLLGALAFEAIYLLVDGVDAFVETASEPHRAVSVLQPLLEQIKDWEERRVFLKLFLPIELRKPLSPLTKRTKTATIKWKPESLIKVVQARLCAGSRGEFDSLDAISAPSLRNAEAELLKAVPPVPRELLVAVNQLIEEHVRRAGPNGVLEPADLEAAIHSYHQMQPQASSP
jgi:hypothetical protein